MSQQKLAKLANHCDHSARVCHQPTVDDGDAQYQVTGQLSLHEPPGYSKFSFPDQNKDLCRGPRAQKGCCIGACCTRHDFQCCTGKREAVTLSIPRGNSRGGKLGETQFLSTSGFDSRLTETQFLLTFGSWKRSSFRRLVVSEKLPKVMSKAMSVQGQVAP